MADELKKRVGDFSNAHLLEEFYLKKAEYSEEALRILEQEIAKRAIGEEEQAPYKEGKLPSTAEEAEIRRYPREEFVPFDHVFSPIDMLLVRTMFMEAEVPFYIDNPQSETVLPIESQTSQFLKIHVHRDFQQQAHALLDEHFVKTDGAYKLKYTGPKERLKAFTFNEISLSEAELYDSVDVSFTTEEAALVVGLAKRLLDEIEKIEADRIVFFYDNLEDLIGELGKGEKASLSRALLLTVLEVLQIYCDDPQFPASLDDVIVALLNLFAPAQA